MCPVLIDFGFFKLYSYGLMMVIAFSLGIYLMIRKSRRYNIKPAFVYDWALYTLVSSMVTARVLYVITHFYEYSNNYISIIFSRGGFVFQGGLIGGILASVIYFQKKKQNILFWADIIFPSLSLGQAIGRLGCTAAGCCYGIEYSGPFSIVFTHPEAIAPHNVELFPSQPFSVLINLIIFIVLNIRYKYKKFTGEIMVLYFILYGIGRFIIENYRAPSTTVILGLTTQQHISIAMFVVGIILYVILYKKNKSKL